MFLLSSMTVFPRSNTDIYIFLSFVCALSLSLSLSMCVCVCVCIHMCVSAQSLQSPPTLCNPIDIAH